MAQNNSKYFTAVALSKQQSYSKYFTAIAQSKQFKVFHSSRSKQETVIQGISQYFKYLKDTSHIICIYTYGIYTTVYTHVHRQIPTADNMSASLSTATQAARTLNQAFE